ncbi:MAG TPA: hypothetical protein VFR97_03150, partial [Capillimicrobium sp.]|nr:hypothetical protein [Capillimicrobium sp.]
MATLEAMPAAAGPELSGPAGGARRRSAAWGQRSLLLPALVLLAAFFVVPLGIMVWRAFSQPELGLSNFTWFFGSDVQVRVLLRTFTTALLVTVVCLALGYPFAYAMTVAGPRTRAALLLLVLVPFWTSLMVRTFAWVILLQDSGVVNDLLGVVGIGPLHLIRTTTGV